LSGKTCFSKEIEKDHEYGMKQCRDDGMEWRFGRLTFGLFHRQIDERLDIIFALYDIYLLILLSLYRAMMLFQRKTQRCQTNQWRVIDQWF
jgi:hypothetical protein